MLGSFNILVARRIHLCLKNNEGECMEEPSSPQEDSHVPRSPSDRSQKHRSNGILTPFPPPRLPLHHCLYLGGAHLHTDHGEIVLPQGNYCEQSHFVFVVRLIRVIFVTYNDWRLLSCFLLGNARELLSPSDSLAKETVAMQSILKSLGCNRED